VGVGPSASPMLNASGRRLVFESRSDLLNGGADTGVWDIYVFDRDADRILRLTHGNGDSHNPYVEETNPGGVFFDSVATNLQGTEETFEGRQIYRAEFSTNVDSVLVSQLTFGPGNKWLPAVNPTAGKVLFVSDADLLSNGTRGARLFSLDFHSTNPVLYQITGR